jgi:hypothetical protein
MGFYEYWHEQQAQKALERQASLELARSWIGHRVQVYFSEVPGHVGYGEVRSVDERGMVFIQTGYNPQGRPWGYTMSANMLGRWVVLADG